MSPGRRARFHAEAMCRLGWPTDLSVGARLPFNSLVAPEPIAPPSLKRWATQLPKRDHNANRLFPFGAAAGGDGKSPEAFSEPPRCPSPARLDLGAFAQG